MKRLPKDATWEDLARQYLPDFTDAQLGYVLWNETSFPFGDLAEIRRHLRQFARRLKPAKAS
jgi:hypothetical protein